MDIRRNRLEKKILYGTSISKLRFASWRRPLKGVEWKLWFEKLSNLHQSTWKKIGIYEAIQNTTYIIKRDDNLVLEMVKRWNSQTNTFIFGWGEATITLEDMLILGGFPALGISPLSSKNDLEVMFMVNKLEKSRLQIQRTQLRNAYHWDWMTKFRDFDDSELEHAAFIAVWLSRHVFPSFACHSNIINKKVFSLAVLLSRGVQIALGQTVLAMLYRDLSALSNTLRSTEPDQSPKVHTFCGLFHIVQVWAWERFMLQKSIPNFVNADPNLPRLARWSDVDHKSLRAFMNYSEQGFVWCPYGAFVINEGTDLLSFAHWIKDSELIGFDSCLVKYYPQRVVKQFGLEQDPPSDKVHTTEDVELIIKPGSSPSSEKKPKLLNNVDDFPPGFPRRVFEIIDIVDSDSDDDTITNVIASKISGSGIGSKRPFPSSNESLTAPCLMKKAESSAKGKNAIIQCATFEELLLPAAPGKSSDKGKNVGIHFGSTGNVLMQNTTTPPHRIKAGFSDKTVGIQGGSTGNVLLQNATPYFVNQAGSSSQSRKDATIQRGTFERVILQAPPGFINKAGSSEDVQTVGIQRGSTENVIQQNAATCLVNKAESSQRGPTVGNPGIRPVRRITMMEHIAQIKREDITNAETEEMEGISSTSQVSQIEHGLSSAALSYTNKRSKNSVLDLEERITRLENIVYPHIRALEAATEQATPANMQEKKLFG